MGSSSSSGKTEELNGETGGLISIADELCLDRGGMLSEVTSLSYLLVTEEDRLEAVVLAVLPLLPVERELFLRCLHFLLKDGKRLVILDMELITNSPDFCGSGGDCALEL